MLRHCWRCAAVLPGVPPVTCAVCAEVHYVNPKPCGCAVAVHDGRVLLLLRAREPDAGRWTLPGGFCDGDEHPMRATERELAEETGLSGRAVAYLGTWMDVYGPPADDGLQIITSVAAYLVALDDPDARPRPDPAEVRELAWFALGEPPSPLAFPDSNGPMLAAAAQLLATGRPLPEPLPDRTWE